MRDQSRFLRLLFEHEVDLRAYVGAMVRDLNQRDDVYQDIAVALWESFEKYEPDKPFGAWARGIARHKILQAYAADRRGMPAMNPQAIDVITQAFDAREHQSDAHLEALRHCLKQLSERSQRLLSLRYESNQTLAAIAASTGQTASGVHRTLARVREALSGCIRGQLGVIENGKPDA